MDTKLLTEIEPAAEILKSGGVVAFPTETVYGLGADATSDLAIEKLFQAKGRPSDNPLIVHLGAIEDWALAASVLTDSAKILLEAFAPGPLTVILPKNDMIVSRVTAGLPNVGIRIPDLPVARELLQRAGRPVAAPSANRSGRPSCTSWQSVLEDMDSRIDAILRGQTTQIGVESTVVDCTRDETAQVLRTGAITQQQIYDLVPQSQLDQKEGDTTRSPGTRHPHYQPNARVLAIDANASIPIPAGSCAYCGLTPLTATRRSIEGAAEDKLSNSTLGRDVKQQIYSSLEEYAADFYAFLRRCDQEGYENIVVELAPAHGIGEALRDRQLRAAGQS